MLDDFLDDLAASPERRIDFFTALRDNPPADLMRLYWLARVTLVADRESIPPFNALFASYFAGAPPIAEPNTEGESEAPPNKSGELQPVLLGEGTGKSASVHDLRNRRRYERHHRRPRRAAQGARASTCRRSKSRGSARAAAARSTSAARSATRPAPARSRTCRAAAARTAQGACSC